MNFNGILGRGKNQAPDKQDKKKNRFYGETLPFQRLETENLQYLSVEQALEDAGSFLASILEEYPPGEEGAKRQPPLTLSYPR